MPLQSLTRKTEITKEANEMMEKLIEGINESPYMPNLTSKRDSKK